MASNWKKIFNTKLVVSGLALSAPLYYYSLNEEEKRKLRVNSGAVVRFFRTFSIGALISIHYKRKLVFLNENTEEYDTTIHQCHLYGAQKLLDGCLRNGGLYIKLGQGLVAMNHILPQEYIETLQVLQDKALNQKPEQVDKLFKQDFDGKTPNDLFLKFDKIPKAAASLAQVHKAKTFSGKDIAVKIQYIDLRDRFDGDMWALRFLMHLVTFVHPKFSFGWILEELEETLAQELDFINEGKNAERCGADLKRYSYVHVPEVLWDFCSKRVLTTEWIDGVKINQTERLKSMGFSLKDIDKKLVSIFAEQIFCTGFVHADPHPGNILVRPNPDHPTAPQLVLLDHGLYDYLKPSDRLALCNFWTAILTRDESKLQKYSLKLGVKDYVSFAEILLQKPLRSSFKFADKDMDALSQDKKPQITQRSAFSLLNNKMTDADLQLIQVIAKNHFDKIMKILKDMPKQMLLIMRNMNTIRAITLEHGDLVNRYVIMAKKAIKGSLESEALKELRKRLAKNGHSFVSSSRLKHFLYTVRNFLWLTYRRLVFGYYLNKEIVSRWIFEIYIKILVLVKVMPREIAQLALYNRYDM